MKLAEQLVEDQSVGAGVVPGVVQPRLQRDLAAVGEVARREGVAYVLVGRTECWVGRSRTHSDAERAG